MPASGPHEERGDLVPEPIDPAVGVDQFDRPVNGVGEVRLAFDHVGPGRRVGVLEVGHEDIGPRVEGVDDHLSLGRPRDLDPATLEVGGRGRDGPLRLTDRPRLGQEVRQRARVEGRLALDAPRETGPAGRFELAVEPRHEVERWRREDPGARSGDGRADLHVPTRSDDSRHPRAPLGSRALDALRPRAAASIPMLT